jgi:hypothetical protein
LAIENVERGFLWDQLTGATNYTGLSATSWTELDPALLRWGLTLSGARPVEFRLSVRIIGSSGQSFGVSLALDGAEVTGTTYGMCMTFSDAAYTQVSGFAVLDNPSPGARTVSVVVRASGGSAAGVAVDGNNRLFMSAKEI